VLLRNLEALAALFAVAVQGVKNDGIRLSRGAYLIHFNGLAFELLIILKKRRSMSMRCGGISAASR